MNKLKSKIIEIVEQLISSYGVALYDVSIKSPSKGKVIIVYLTKVGGITLEDCTKVSRELSLILDEKELVKGKYFLEVSSPGVTRKLKLKKHYKSAINELVRIRYADEENKKHKVKGILKEVLPNYIKIESKGELINIQFKNIKKAKTVYKEK